MRRCLCGAVCESGVCVSHARHHAFCTQTRVTCTGNAAAAAAIASETPPAVERNRKEAQKDTMSVFHQEEHAEHAVRMWVGCDGDGDDGTSLCVCVSAMSA